MQDPQASLTFAASYDNGLVLTLSGKSMDAFLRSSIWRVRMPAARAAEPRIEGQRLIFDPQLSYGRCRSIIEGIQRLARYGVACEIAESYAAFARESETHIEERANVGLAIKRQDDELLDRFHRFRDVIDAAMIRPLRDKQAWDAFYLTAMRKAANFSVPGSGKTATVLGAFAYLRSLDLVSRVVVISPKNAFGSWKDEWGASFGDKLPCRSLCFHEAPFTSMDVREKKRELLLNAGRYNLLLMNYEACGTYESELRSLCAEKTLLVFDEIHKIKRIGGIRAGSAMAVASSAQYVVALTGTPIPNSYCDISNLLHILCPEDYDDFFGFRAQMLEHPSARDIERINSAVQPFFCRTNKNMLGVPPVNDDSIVRVPASNEENALLEELKASLRGNPLALIIRVLQLESDPGMVFDALTPQQVPGFADEEFDDGTDFGGPLAMTPSNSSLVREGSPSVKLRACLDLVDQLVDEDKSIIVWCVFIRSIENIAAGLEERGIAPCVITGSTDMEERKSILADFKERRARVLITNPHTLAESVSLHSVCHDAVYFEYSYNLVHLLQSKDRIHRLGLPDGQYTQYHFLQTVFDLGGHEWSLDENIYKRLKEKEQTMLDAIDRGELELGSTDENDLEIVFKGLF